MESALVDYAESSAHLSDEGSGCRGPGLIGRFVVFGVDYGDGAFVVERLESMCRVVTFLVVMMVSVEKNERRWRRGSEIWAGQRRDGLHHSRPDPDAKI